jgi:hypothetical protein
MISRRTTQALAALCASVFVQHRGPLPYDADGDMMYDFLYANGCESYLMNLAKRLSGER